MAVQAQYASQVFNGQTLLSLANPNRDGTGSIAGIFTGPYLNGCRVDSLSITAIGTTTAGMIRLYSYFVIGGTYRLLLEIPVQAITPSATVPAWNVTLRNLNWNFEFQVLLAASTEKAESFHVVTTASGAY